MSWLRQEIFASTRGFERRQQSYRIVGQDGKIALSTADSQSHCVAATKALCTLSSEASGYSPSAEQPGTPLNSPININIAIVAAILASCIVFTSPLPSQHN